MDSSAASSSPLVFENCAALFEYLRACEGSRRFVKEEAAGVKKEEEEYDSLKCDSDEEIVDVSLPAAARSSITTQTAPRATLPPRARNPTRACRYRGPYASSAALHEFRKEFERTQSGKTYLIEGRCLSVYCNHPGRWTIKSRRADINHSPYCLTKDAPAADRDDEVSRP